MVTASTSYEFPPSIRGVSSRPWVPTVPLTSGSATVPPVIAFYGIIGEKFTFVTPIMSDDLPAFSVITDQPSPEDEIFWGILTPEEEMYGWLKLAEGSFARFWDNEDDAFFDNL